MESRVYVLIALLLASLVSLKAQDEESSYLKVVNLIDTGADSIFSLDGYIFKRGNPVPSGFASGAFKLDPGSHTIAMNNKGAKNDRYKVSLEMAAGSTHSVLFYSEKEVRKNSKGEQVEVFEIKHKVMQGQDEIGEPRLTVFSLCSAEVLDFAVRKKAYKVGRNQSIQIPVSLENVTITKLDGTKIGVVEIISPFHYVVIIDDKAPDGKYRFTFFEQRQYLKVVEPTEVNAEKN